MIVRALPRAAEGSGYPFHFEASTDVPGSRLLVIGRYRMGFDVEPLGSASHVRIWIDYRLPQARLARWLGAAAGRFYARWCTQQMLSGIRGA